MSEQRAVNRLGHVAIPRRTAGQAMCQHTPAPKPYPAWHKWAARKSETHRQVRCPGCGLFKLWVPKAMS